MKLSKKLIALLLVLSIVLSVVIPISLTTSAADKGVILEWDFEDVDGTTVKDISGNGKDGTIEGATVANGVATFTGGEQEYVRLPAKLFDGCSTADTITIELVMSPTKTDIWTTFLRFGTSAEDFVALAIMGDRNLRFATKRNGSQKEVNSDSSPLALKAENIVKYVFTPTKTIIYVNGIHVTEVDTGAEYFLGNFDNVEAYLGGIAFWAGNSCFNGTISHLKISVSETVAPVNRTVKPTLADATGEVLGYINFADRGKDINISSVATKNNGVTVEDGVATFAGTKLSDGDHTSNDNAVVFDSSLLANIKDTLTIEMTIRPTIISDHRVIMSIGDGDDFYAVMGMQNTNAIKFNEGRTSSNIISTGEWITLKYVINASSAYIYVNDELYYKTSSIDLKKLAMSSEPIKFGQRTVAWNDDCFAGDVSEIRITTSASKTLDFNLRAVNALNGDTEITKNTELTVQYTDATLGDGIEMYAQLTKKDGTAISGAEKQPVSNGFLRVKNQNVLGAKEEIGVSTEGTTISQPIYSAKAGSVTFSFSGLGSSTYNVSDVEVTVWIEDSTNASNKATTLINNGFTTSDTPTGLTPQNWMSYIDGATLLSQINLPGSHDSGSRYFLNSRSYPYQTSSTRYNISTALQAKPVVTQYSTAHDYNVCQSTDILTQLKDGVRYLDIRCDTIDIDVSGYGGTRYPSTEDGDTLDNFAISHAYYEAYVDSGCSEVLTFNHVYQYCKTFLEANSSECIVMVLNDEKCTDRSNLVGRVQSFVNADPDLFYTKSNEIPTLDDVRGKIVLLRRYPYNYVDDDNDFMEFYWLDGEENANVMSNSAHSIITASNTSAGVTTYWVQDKYKLATNNKLTEAQAFVTQAADNKQPNEYYINFFSTAGSTSTKPSSSSGTINKAFLDSSYNLPKGEQYGYLLFDFITADICKKVYNTNIFTTEPQVVKDSNNKVVNNESSNDKVVHYDFANIENNTLDDLEDNGFDATLLNTDNLEINSIYDIITFNNSGKLKGVAGSVSIPSSVFRGSGNTATIQMWMKDTSESHTTLFSIGQLKKNYNDDFFQFLTKNHADAANDSVYYKFARRNYTTKDKWIEDEQHTLGTWHLVTYVLNGESVNVYIDNELIIENGPTIANFSDVDGGIYNGTRVLLGATSMHDDQGFIGSMGDFTIYNYAVDKNEIADKYAELADEYTYILKASLGSGALAKASLDASQNYIDEQYTDEGSTIWLTAPASYVLKKATLNLEYDGSYVEIAENGKDYNPFIQSQSYDLSGDNVLLKVTSLNGKRTKVYELNVVQTTKSIVVKDIETEENVEVYNNVDTKELKQTVKNANLLDYYNTISGATSGSNSITANAGDTVYVKRIPVAIATNAGKQIRLEAAEEGRTNGIRFRATIAREEFYNYFNKRFDKNYVFGDENCQFTFGMLIIPGSKLNGNKLTLENFSDLGAVNIAGKKVYKQNNDGNLEYTGVIYNIPVSAYDTELVARAYISFKYNNETYTFYSEEVDCGSYRGVAKTLYESSSTKTEDVMSALKEIINT